MKSLLRPGPQAAPAAGSQGATGFSELRVLAPQPGWQREEAEGPQGSHSRLAVGFKWQSVSQVSSNRSPDAAWKGALWRRSLTWGAGMDWSCLPQTRAKPQSHKYGVFTP